MGGGETLSPTPYPDTPFLHRANADREWRRTEELTGVTGISRNGGKGGALYASPCATPRWS